MEALFSQRSVWDSAMDSESREEEERIKVLLDFNGKHRKVAVYNFEELEQAARREFRLEDLRLVDMNFKEITTETFSSEHQNLFVFRKEEGSLFFLFRIFRSSSFVRAPARSCENKNLPI